MSRPNRNSPLPILGFFFRRASVLAIPVFFAVFAVSAGMGLAKGSRMKGDPQAGPELRSSRYEGPSMFKVLLGKWQRTDSGSELEIRDVVPGGGLYAVYRTPKDIRVSQASAFKESGEIRIFIELRDAGYPGCTYRLTYQAQRDELKGIYFQPVLNQTRDVVFTRQRTVKTFG